MSQTAVRTLQRQARSYLRPLLLVGVVVFIITQIVAFSPSALEQSETTQVDPEQFMEEESPEMLRAPGIPTDRIPDYSIDAFDYVSTQNGVKQWKMLANKANLYSKEQLVHARGVTAHLYDSDGKITVVSGLEAKYFTNRRDLEVFGNVVTTFPDGFKVYSEYMHYKPDTRLVEIPSEYAVRGSGNSGGSQTLDFSSSGMDFEMNQSRIILPNNADVTVYQTKPGTSRSKSDDWTNIKSDHCLILREKQIAYFTMSPSRPIESRFVRIQQPALFSRARKVELNYNNLSTAPSPASASSKTGGKMLNYMTADEDVLIRELKKDETLLRYATGGKAVFDNVNDVIVLTEFPQVYQDEDTVTGDVITVHRNSDIVEVDHSNAFSDGE